MLIFCVHKTAFYVHEDPLYSHLCPSECPPARIFPHSIPSPSSPPSLPRILPCHPVTPVTPVTVTTWKGTSHPPWGSGSWYKQQKDFGDQLNGDQRKNFKYLDAQQVGQQISLFFKSEFHNEGGDWEKSYVEVFFWQWSHLSLPKISTFSDPSSRIFAHISNIFNRC